MKDKSKQKKDLKFLERQTNSCTNWKSRLSTEKQKKIQNNTPENFLYNDYTTYFERTPRTNKKSNLEINRKNQEKQLKNYSRNIALKNSNLISLMDNQDFVQTKSYCSTKSLRHHHCKALKHQQNSFSKINELESKTELKIFNLENKILLLSKKLENCECESKKNHYQFMLLREIIEKMRIQNLSLISKLDSYDMFFKKSVNENLTRVNNFVQDQQLYQIKKNKIFNNSNKSQERFQFSFKDDSLMHNNDQENLEIQSNSKTNQTNYMQDLTHTGFFCHPQKSLLSQHQNQKKLIKKVSESINHTQKKNQNYLTVNNIKTKIVNCSKATKQEKQQKDKKKPQTIDQISEIFQRSGQAFEQNLGDNTQNKESLYFSEENLLESNETIQKTQQSLKQFGQIQQKNSIYTSKLQKQLTKAQIKLSSYGENHRIRHSKQEITPRDQSQINALNQIQAQYNQLLSILNFFHSKKKALNHNSGQSGKNQAQIEKIQKVLKLSKQAMT